MEGVVIGDGAVSGLHDYKDPVSVRDVNREEETAMGEYVYALGPFPDLGISISVS